MAIVVVVVVVFPVYMPLSLSFWRPTTILGETALVLCVGGLSSSLSRVCVAVGASAADFSRFGG